MKTRFFITLGLLALCTVLLSFISDADAAKTNACVNETTGAIRLLLSGGCNSGEYGIALNIEGKQGPVGPRGPVGPQGPQGPEGPPGPQQGRDPLQVALLRWYQANQTTSFNVGSAPYGVAFDGTCIWVANYNSDTVTKLNASDGSLVGTYNTGISPRGIAFDGANIWVANSQSNTVSKF